MTTNNNVEKITSLEKHNAYLREKISYAKESFIKDCYKEIIKNNKRMISYYRKKLNNQGA